MKLLQGKYNSLIMKYKTSKNDTFINFKKLFTFAFNQFERETENYNQKLRLIQLSKEIKKCFSIKDLCQILIQNQDYQQKLIQLHRSQALLHRLIAGKGYHRNFAQCLKNFNMLLNMIHAPKRLQNVYWTSNHNVSIPQNLNKKEIVQ